jgi:AraC-like DNA-binding protein
LDKVVFTSNQLPSGLTDQERFKEWSELYHGAFGMRGDFEVSAAPFEAHMVFAKVGEVVLVRATAHVASSDHGGRGRATAEDEERMGFLVNTSAHPIRSSHRGREELLQPGESMLLSRAEQGSFVSGGEYISWVIVDMPRIVIARAAPNAEDLIGAVLSSGGEALRMAKAYASLVFQESGFADPRLDTHVSETVLDLVALAAGAAKDTAEIARDRGLRAARLDAVVRAIGNGYADPAFSIAAVAAKLNLSERYIQDLLQSTGVGFSERVMELRLQHSAGLLARAHLTQRKISDVALSSGFNDLSYFHRCFRRRFGVTPAQARP